MLKARRHSDLSLAGAFVASFVFHVVLFIVLDLLGKWGAMTSKHLIRQAEKSQVLQFEIVEPQAESEPIPNIFVDASPNPSSKEKPDKTPFYSVMDAVSADAHPEDSQEQAKIEGMQDKVLKTMDTPSPVMKIDAVPSFEDLFEKQTSQTLQVSKISKASKISQASQVSNEDSFMEIVEGQSEEEDALALFKDSLPNFESNKQSKKLHQITRPRRLIDVQKQQAIVGEKMRQEGGTKRYRLQSTPDLLATPFAKYDQRLIAAIQQHWFNVLNSSQSLRNARGRVVLKFKMYSDGSVRALDVVEDSVGVMQSLACQKAVSEPAPYAPWPEDMRRMIGSDHREVRFSFFYN